MRSMRSAAMISLVMLLAGSGCATLNPTAFIAKHAGAAIGAKLADAVPARATVAPTAKGGNFCDTAIALGGPVPLAGLPRNAASEFSLAVDQFGATHGCWKEK